jgi:hypothetical protein
MSALLFKLIPNPTFWETAHLTVPGQATPVPVEFEFKHHTREEMDAYWRAAKSGTDQENLARLVQGWKGIDKDFSQEHLAILINQYPTAAKEIYTAFQKGQLESRTKN